MWQVVGCLADEARVGCPVAYFEAALVMLLVFEKTSGVLRVAVQANQVPSKKPNVCILSSDLQEL
jgi:hypothetical protein